MKLVRFVYDSRILQGYMNDKGQIVDESERIYDLNQVCLLPPVHPGKIIGLARNFQVENKPNGNSMLPEPIVFLKGLNTCTGHKQDIVVPEEVHQLIYEIELAVVIAKTCKNVTAEHAMDYVLGYTIANDLTARDFLTSDMQPSVKSKSFDGFCPLGPYLVTKDEIQDPHDLKMTVCVNGEVRQTGSTRDMIFKIPEIISYVSEFMTLDAYDVILTGAPKPVTTVHAGDTLSLKIHQLGVLENRFVH